jgi:shikimate dehydrogenase
VTVTAATRLYALLGQPVAHSFSPVMHNAALTAAGIDAVYVAIPCDADAVAPLIRTLALGGGGGNVTIPHKQCAAAALDAPEPVVTRTGACNTFWADGGRVRGDNTDVIGVRTVAVRMTGGLHGTRAIVVGSGGAARAAVFALLDGGARVELIARSADRAADLVARLDPGGERIGVHGSVDALDGIACDLIVNATPLGMHDGDAPPVDLNRVRAGAVIDMVYRPGGTALTASAARLGVPAIDGLEILVVQGGAAFERWHGRAAPLERMREVVEASAAAC